MWRVHPDGDDYQENDVDNRWYTDWPIAGATDMSPLTAVGITIDTAHETQVDSTRACCERRLGTHHRHR